MTRVHSGEKESQEVNLDRRDGSQRAGLCVVRDMKGEKQNRATA